MPIQILLGCLLEQLGQHLHRAEKIVFVRFPLKHQGANSSWKATTIFAIFFPHNFRLDSNCWNIGVKRNFGKRVSVTNMTSLKRRRQTWQSSMLLRWNINPTLSLPPPPKAPSLSLYPHHHQRPPRYFTLIPAEQCCSTCQCSEVLRVRPQCWDGKLITICRRLITSTSEHSVGPLQGIYMSFTQKQQQQKQKQQQQQQQQQQKSRQYKICLLSKLMFDWHWSEYHC